MRRALSAVPTAAQMPWPSDPVATSTNGSRGVGCPSRSESICPQLQQLFAREQTRLRPRPRTESARRAPSTARSDRCRGSAGPSDRSASRRRTASPRSRPPTGSSSDGRCRLRSWTAPNRCGAGWRCSCRAASGVVIDGAFIACSARQGREPACTRIGSVSPGRGGAHGQHVVRGERSLAAASGAIAARVRVGDAARIPARPRRSARRRSVRDASQLARERLQRAGASGRSPASASSGPARDRRSRRRASSHMTRIA